ncbi:capsular polysaccharide export protein, LipB/KpsS family [Yoonia sp.]|uniref:capsular polysaccharide export protein, LipB/KpsS family n=1 Tax=Yoonia sp. TaxID=2212373 RepID=UPI003F6B5388
MSEENTVTFYLHDNLRQQAMAGRHNFMLKLSEVLTSAGMTVAFDDDTDAARLRAIARPGRSLHLMENPATARGLTLRRTYLYPFWHIERQGKRWDWPVAHAQFSPCAQNPTKAADFYRFWQNRLFDEGPAQATRDGFVYVPLQGHLTTCRSFQFCSPIDMVQAVLDHDPGRKVIVTLHPSEDYSPLEQDALNALMHDHSRLDVRSGGMERYLRNCDYVVTQNSGAGFMGYFFGKPLVLFGKTDFHHIALNVGDIGLAEAFARVDRHEPDYAAYLYWFLQKRSINAGRPEVLQKIRTVLRGHGWPV